MSTAVIDDKVFMSISDLKSVDSINHSNLDLLVSMSWSISLVLVLSFILKRILLYKNLAFLAFLQMFICMIYCVVVLFYFKNIFKVLLQYNQIGLLYDVRHFCLLSILIVNYQSLRNLHKQENQYTSLVDKLHRILFDEN
ncbi:hypothetical protein K4I04_1959 [Streptococcus sanguinis]|nr:hypothetical protein [Streptococcus sanguinis]